MKKFFVISVLVLCVISSFVFLKNVESNYVKTLFNLDIKEICFVVNSRIFDKTKMNLGYNKCLINGDKCFLYFSSISQFDNLIEKFDYLEVSYNLNDVKEFFKDVNTRIVYKEKLNEKEIYYGYCPNLEKYIIFKNYKVNIQIVSGENFFKVGYPMVYTSY